MTRSLADRCQGVMDIWGAKVPRFTLYRTYGKPGKPNEFGAEILSKFKEQL